MPPDKRNGPEVASRPAPEVMSATAPTVHGTADIDRHRRHVAALDELLAVVRAYGFGAPVEAADDADLWHDSHMDLTVCGREHVGAAI